MLYENDFRYEYNLTSYNAHKIILVALILAHKYMVDSFPGLKLAAKVVDLSIEQLRILEDEFLSLIEFKLYVGQDHFENYLHSIEYFDQYLIMSGQLKPKVRGSKNGCKPNNNKPKQKDKSMLKSCDVSDKPLSRVGTCRTSIENDVKLTISTRSLMMNKEPADLTPSSMIQNMDAYSNFYADDPEWNSQEPEESLRSDATMYDGSDSEPENIDLNLIMT